MMYLVLAFQVILIKFNKKIKPCCAMFIVCSYIVLYAIFVFMLCICKYYRLFKVVKGCYTQNLGFWIIL